MSKLPLDKIWEVKLLQEEYCRIWARINQLIEKEGLYGQRNKLEEGNKE